MTSGVEPGIAVYLAGPINGTSDRDCREWREAAKSMLGSGFRFLDPMERDYRGVESLFAEELVAADKRAIEMADLVLVNATKPSWGTAMEVLFAYSIKTAVVAFAQPPASPWLMVHATFLCPSLDDAIFQVKALTQRLPGETIEATSDRRV